MDILKNSWNKENYAIFADMGTGKSKVIIDNIAILHDKGKNQLRPQAVASKNQKG